MAAAQVAKAAEVPAMMTMLMMMAMIVARARARGKNEAVNRFHFIN